MPPGADKATANPASIATSNAGTDAAHEVSTDSDRDQWMNDAKALHLNPAGRAQTKKRRPTIPVPRQMVPLLNENSGFFVPVASVRRAFETMSAELKLPRNRKTGMKLIRRSIAQIARDRLDEFEWAQGRVMLGHEKASTSDVYALRKPSCLGAALRVTEEIIDEIETLTPGAFTGIAPEKIAAKDS